MESPTTAAAAPAPEEAAPYSSPASSPLVYNVSVAFLPSAISAAQDLASTLFNQSDKALYAIVAANGAVNITDLVYGYVPNVAALAPAPGPFTSLSVAPAAAAAPEASAGAAIESYTDPVRLFTCASHISQQHVLA